MRRETPPGQGHHQGGGTEWREGGKDKCVGPGLALGFARSPCCWTPLVMPRGGAEAKLQGTMPSWSLPTIAGPWDLDRGMLAPHTCTLVRWPNWDSLAPRTPLRLAGRRQRRCRLLPVWCLCHLAPSHPQSRVQPRCPPISHPVLGWLLPRYGVAPQSLECTFLLSTGLF